MDKCSLVECQKHTHNTKKQEFFYPVRFSIKMQSYDSVKVKKYNLCWFTAWLYIPRGVGCTADGHPRGLELWRDGGQTQAFLDHPLWVRKGESPPPTRSERQMGHEQARHSAQAAPRTAVSASPTEGAKTWHILLHSDIVKRYKKTLGQKEWMVSDSNPQHPQWLKLTSISREFNVILSFFYIFWNNKFSF